MLSLVDELDAGSADELLHRAGDQDLAGVGKGTDPRGDVHGQPGEIAASDFALARV